MNKCDIIVPIYNAYDCVVECVDSVIRNTDMKQNRLILINDKSPDERISKLLNKYKNKYKDIIVIENEENKGFVGTVNVGMKQSDKNDVLLLNSDTVVTPNWMDNIKKCAYSGEDIATVTPLSNNATMASVPIPFVKNELVADFSIDDMAKIVEECSYKDYPDLPTGHGFCLYIKRVVLNKIGYFDEETFGKGYGEENDFCFRCLDNGYRNLLCDNVYIYHKESQSFSDAKIALMKSGGEKLRKRYPEYTKKLDEWCRRLPIRYIGQNVGLSMEKNMNKKNILVLIHDWHDVENHLGGTTLHVYDIIQSLRNKYNFHVLSEADNVYTLTSYWTNSESSLVFPIFFDSRKYQTYNNEYKKIIMQIFDDFSIDLVHIHHMKNHYFDILDIAKSKDVKIVYSIHDFYSVCPIINKMYCNKEYCHNPSNERCVECMKKTYGFNENMIFEWRNRFNKLFDYSYKVIAPTKSCKDELLMTYNNLKVDIIKHGVDLEKIERDYQLGDKINVAFLGAIGIIKGSNIVSEILKKKYNKINFHLFGVYDRVLSRSEKKRIICHGQYKREELPELFKKNKIDLVCLLSICPETYSYTLTEAIANEIPVLVSNLGALKERVEKDSLGWVVDLECDNPAKVVIDKIKEIQKDRDDYNKKLESIRNYKIRTVKMMVKDYDKIYSGILKNNSSINIAEIRNKIKNNEKYVSFVSYSDYAWVFDTLKWRIISKIKIPDNIKRVFRRDKND